MRKQNREVVSFEEKCRIVDKCDTIRIGIIDNDIPYIVPLSFGYEVNNSQLTFYMHGAKEGRKHQLISGGKKKISFELDVLNRYCKHGDSVTADYESIMGEGYIEIVENKDEAVKGIELLLKHCNYQDIDAKKCVALGITEVYKITVENFVGKRRFN